MTSAGSGGTSTGKGDLELFRIRALRFQPWPDTLRTRSAIRDEYVALLKKFDVEYDPAYLFTFIDDVG